MSIFLSWVLLIHISLSLSLITHSDYPLQIHSDSDATVSMRHPLCWKRANTCLGQREEWNPVRGNISVDKKGCYLVIVCLSLYSKKQVKTWFICTLQNHCYINTCLASFKAWISFHFPSNWSYNEHKNDNDNDNDLLSSFKVQRNIKIDSCI